MKQFYFFLILASMLSCSKNAPVLNNSDQLDAAPQITYDTTAIDSFGPGATSEAVMAKINAVAIKREKDSLAAIAKVEQEKLDKEKAKKEEENKTDKKTEDKPTEEVKTN
ncbi:hypothetical protein ACFOWU_13910 [Epilithonimonas zeae]|uniref:Uncharacterized protein n=1 Tax=Epilithonimonas zeae TaxID=1416779 RepID=A0A1N6IS05_9FLAO|nr:hypothetical protein [Epilithonimonas zeae]SIO34812.1 hypothetical protein SAMN05444409_2938 [Epilithonimonas zeae]